MSNLVCNYDRDKNLLFIQKNRCGTSLLHELIQSHRCPGLQRYSYQQIFEQFDSSMLSVNGLKIATIFRHPIRNFISSLNLLIDARTMEFVDQDHFDPHYYHLGDAHAQHDLIQALIWGAAGFDIQFVRLSGYTDFLINHYPQCKSIISAKHMPDSFDARSCDTSQVKLWLKYEEFINSNEFSCDLYNSWEDWMEPELKLFEYYLLCEKQNDYEKRRDLCLYAMEYLLNHRHYWSEVSYKPSRVKSQLELILLLAKNYPGCFPDSLVSIADHKIRSITPYPHTNR